MEGDAAEAGAEEARRKRAVITRRVLREWIVAQLDLANDPLPCAPSTTAIADCLERGVVDGRPLTGRTLKTYCQNKPVESLKLLTDLGLDDATARRIHDKCRARRRATVASPVLNGTGQKRRPADAGLPTGNPANCPDESASETAPMHVDAAPLSPERVLKAARFDCTLAASARPFERASARLCVPVAPQCGPTHRRLHKRMHVQAHRRTTSSSRVSHRSRPSRQPPPLRQPRTSSANRNVAALPPATRPGGRTAPRPRRPALSPRRTWRPSSRHASEHSA